MRRVFDCLMRHLVRWLRRHRYARMADRTRALEIELGIIRPDDAARERLELLADHVSTRSVAEIREILTHPDQLAEAFATRESTEKLISDYAAAFDAKPKEHPPYPTALHDWSGEKECPQCVRMLDIARLTARTSE